MQSRLQWGLQVHAVIPLQSYNPSFRGDLHGSGLIRQPCIHMEIQIFTLITALNKYNLLHDIHIAESVLLRKGWHCLQTEEQSVPYA